jgi:hypothetical protein
LFHASPRAPAIIPLAVFEDQNFYKKGIASTDSTLKSNEGRSMHEAAVLVRLVGLEQSGLHTLAETKSSNDV